MGKDPTYWRHSTHRRNTHGKWERLRCLQIDTKTYCLHIHPVLQYYIYKIYRCVTLWLYIIYNIHHALATQTSNSELEGGPVLCYSRGDSWYFVSASDSKLRILTNSYTWWLLSEGNLAEYSESCFSRRLIHSPSGKLLFSYNVFGFITLSETNSLHLKIGNWKMIFLLERLPCICHDNFREPYLSPRILHLIISSVPPWA